MLPSVDRHFEIPKEREEFCVFDSGIGDPERVLIFEDRENIQNLIIHQDVWLCDRTFKVRPIQFYQLFTTHNQLAEFYHPPPSPAFMHSQKKEHIDKKLLKGSSAITKNTEPHRILIDFERAALNAFASHHVGSLLKG